jgi:hypothetical protein
MAEINDRRHSDGSSRSKPPGEPASMLALFATILAVSIGLALWTDMNIVLRGVIAIAAGIAAAAITLAAVNRRAAQKSRTPGHSVDDPTGQTRIDR